MKKKVSIIILCLFLSLSSQSQEVEQDILDSIHAYSQTESTFKLQLIKNCKFAQVVAQYDIKNDDPKLLIVGGISPIVYTDDTIFERKYKISYYDYGCISPASKCVYSYNAVMYEYLTDKYGKMWRKEIRKDVYGLKKWKREKKKKTSHNNGYTP